MSLYKSSDFWGIPVNVDKVYSDTLILEMAIFEEQINFNIRKRRPVLCNVLGIAFCGTFLPRDSLYK
jgi:hypothetical protein